MLATRQRAGEAIASGRVLVNGAPATKASRLVAPDDQLVVTPAPSPFVSRGGHKLAAALDRFDVAVHGRLALDAGASTGGFTDCLLQRGAAGVVAVDVGYGQLDVRLRHDPRVCVLERTNVRALDPHSLARAVQEACPQWQVPETLQVPLVTADLSFISLRTVAPVLAGSLLAPGGDLVALVKPQFEAGRVAAARGRGVIRDPEVWLEAVHQVAVAIEGCGPGIMDVMSSPLTGPAGNRELLVHARSGAPLLGPTGVQRLAEAAIAAMHPVVGP